MLYFVPAWYKDQTWCEKEQAWYERRTKSEFDETIKQITLFHRNVDVEYKILLLAYSPNFRHFLHRQGMYRAAYWSCFDAICQIRRTKTAVLSFRDIKWPDGMEFVYSPFAISVFHHGEKYAQIEFGEDGNPITINMYENGVIVRKNYYDDRGFVSGSVVYEDGNEIYQDYMTEQGIWKMRQFASDGHVEINPNYPCFDIAFDGRVEEVTLKQSTYISMEELIEEVLTEYIRHTSAEDKFFVAAHPLHIELLDRCLASKDIVTTFFEDRFDYDRIDIIRGFLESSDYIITDSKKTTEIIQKKLPQSKLHITDIPPYDTRMDFGISSQLKVQNILLPIDGIEHSAYKQIIGEVACYLQTNELARVHIFTRDASWGREDQIKEELADILEELGFSSAWVIERTPHIVAENNMDDENSEVQRFYVDVCVDERTISKCINEQRVILDLRQTMDVFMFVTAISKGVPRISMSDDQFYAHGKNGYRIHTYSEINESLHFYLDSMENWNAALVQGYEIGRKYTTDVLLEAWRKVLGIVE